MVWISSQGTGIALTYPIVGGWYKDYGRDDRYKDMTDMYADKCCRIVV